MYEVLLKNMDRSSADRVLALPVQDGLEMVRVNEIVVCEAAAQYPPSTCATSPEW